MPRPAEPEPRPAPPASPLAALEPLRFSETPFDGPERVEAVLAHLFGPSFEDPLPDADGPARAGSVTVVARIPESLDPGLERALTAQLPEETRARLARFSHPARRMQSLFGRLLAQRLVNVASHAGQQAFRLREQPPEGPLLADYSGVPAGRFAVAHTDGCAAVSLSCLPMGIDLELDGRARRTRRLAGLADFAFGPEFARLITEAAAIEPLRAEEAFLAAWGVLESAQKMNGEDRESASASAWDDARLKKYARARAVKLKWTADGIVARAPDGSDVPRRFVRTPGGLLTLLGGGPEGSPRALELLEVAPEALLAELEGHAHNYV